MYVWGRDRIRRHSFWVWYVTEPCLIHKYRSMLLLVIYWNSCPDQPHIISHRHFNTIWALLWCMAHWHNFLFELCQRTYIFFLQKRFVSRLFLTSGKEAFTWSALKIKLFSVTGQTQRNTQLVTICAWEQIKPRSSNNEIAIDNIKTITRLKT